MPNGIPIPLEGISIGDGMMDPITQIPGYGALLFGLSLIDADQKAYMEKVEAQIVDCAQNERWLEGFRLFDPLMMGDEVRYTVREHREPVYGHLRLTISDLAGCHVLFPSVAIWFLLQQCNWFD